MNGTEIRCLLACAALAAGELLASLAPRGAEAWPAFALAAAWLLLTGYGFSVKGWPYAFLVLSGVALFCFSKVDEERRYREQPWMRGVRARTAEAAVPPLRRDLSRRVGIGLDHNRPAAVLNRAILLGERRGIPEETRRAFVESGTIHVFAISGLHVMIVAKVLMALVALLLVPLRFQGAVALVPVWGYVALIGMPPSALRAALMASVYFLAPLFWRKSSGLVAWAIAFLVSHVLFPGLVVDTGSQLSYMVMLSLILAGRVSANGFFQAAAAWAAGLPIAAMTFGRITPGGLLANLVLLSAAACSVVAGAIGALTSYVCEPLAAHLNNLSALATDAMVAISETVARLPGSNFEIDPWSPAMCIEWYAAFGLSLYLVHRARTPRIDF